MTHKEIRATALHVDLSAIRHNIGVAQRTVGQGVAVWPVIKADGYGLGAVAIARMLQDESLRYQRHRSTHGGDSDASAGADQTDSPTQDLHPLHQALPAVQPVAGICVALVEEAVQLREAGITLPIRLLSGLSAFGGRIDISLLNQLKLEPFVASLEDVAKLSEAVGSVRGIPPVRAHLKLQTGMGRLGLGVDAALTQWSRWADAPGIAWQGVVSHLACADDPASPVTDRQIRRFGRFLADSRLQHPKWHDLQISLANSAGILAHQESHYQWVRPGIMIYGASPFFDPALWSHEIPKDEEGAAQKGTQWGLRPTVRWRTRIQQIQEHPAGEGLSYGHTFTPQRRSRIGWLPVGYADGYARQLGNRGEVLIHGERAPVVGRVCMDLIAVDLTDLPRAKAGDRVTLLGEDDAGGEISTEEMAAWCNTIPYEITCAIGSRVPRLHSP